jgi:hypothetical protein
VCGGGADNQWPTGGGVSCVPGGSLKFEMSQRYPQAF